MFKNFIKSNTFWIGASEKKSNWLWNSNKKIVNYAKPIYESGFYDDHCLRGHFADEGLLLQVDNCNKKHRAICMMDNTDDEIIDDNSKVELSESDYTFIFKTLHGEMVYR